MADALLREGLFCREGLAEVHRFISLVEGAGDMVAYLWRQVALADEPNVMLYLLEAQKAQASASNYLWFAEQYLRSQRVGAVLQRACQCALSLLRGNPQPFLAWSEDALAWPVAARHRRERRVEPVGFRGRLWPCGRSVAACAIGRGSAPAQVESIRKESRGAPPSIPK